MISRAMSMFVCILFSGSSTLDGDQYRLYVPIFTGYCTSATDPGRYAHRPFLLALSSVAYVRLYWFLAPLWVHVGRSPKDSMHSRMRGPSRYASIQDL